MSQKMKKEDTHFSTVIARKLWYARRLTKPAALLASRRSRGPLGRQSLKAGLLRPFGARNDGRGISILVLLTLFFATNCYAAVWSSNELIEKARELNGRKLNYRGELVTVVLNRGEYSWINLNDGSNAIGVWCKSSLLGDVRFAGDYKNRGDIIEVNGTFNRACSIHNGELDIHADTIKIVKKGHSFKMAIDLKRINSAIALFAFTILTVIIFRKRL